jgi:hypothetical protein
MFQTPIGMGANVKSATLLALSVFLAFAAIPTTAQFIPNEKLVPQHPQQPELIDNLYGLRLCPQPYALCEASICTPTGRMITVNGPNGTHPQFPEAACACPILPGPALADVNGGNMKGNCDFPGPNQVWSLYVPKDHLPQEINNWSTTPPGNNVLQQLCSDSLGVGQSFANCFSFACTIDQNPRNGVRTATCFCPMGENLNGTPVTSPNTAVVTPAGQCLEDVCFQHPVGAAAQQANGDASMCLGPPFPPSR